MPFRFFSAFGNHALSLIEVCPVFTVTRSILTSSFIRKSINLRRFVEVVTLHPRTGSNIRFRLLDVRRLYRYLVDLQMIDRHLTCLTSLDAIQGFVPAIGHHALSMIGVCPVFTGTRSMSTSSFI